MDGNVRIARFEDHEAFENLYSQCAYLDAAGCSAHAEPFGEKHFKEMCEGNIFVAENKAGELVGYAIIYASAIFDDVIELSEMFVSNSVRNTGVGRKLLNCVENNVRECGFKYLDLMSFSMETDRVWEHMGFKSINFSEHYRKALY